METLLVRLLSDIHSAIDSGEVAILALLDVSAAFDSVDHDILLLRLKNSFGTRGQVFEWLESFIRGRLNRSSLVAFDLSGVRSQLGCHRDQFSDHSCMSCSQRMYSRSLVKLVLGFSSMLMTPRHINIASLEMR